MSGILKKYFMRLKKLLVILIFGFVVWSCQKEEDEEKINGQFNAETDQIVTEKREMRGVWIATVSNLDWPTTKGNASAQKSELISILDKCKGLNMNAVVLQIRPNADAFYSSDLEPWSAFLTGTQGMDPGYDPLKFAVEEAHKRGLELHAWLNPYRIGATSVVLAPNHVAVKNPSWMVVYNGVRYFNPGIPEVRAHLISVVKDIVARYSVDAIHFDDYFYPSGAKSTVTPFGFDDKEAFSKYGGNLDVHQWRAENVNTMVFQVYKAVKSVNPKVYFGISPSGRRENSLDLYADPLVWLNGKWVDYLAPQIYWEYGHATADFGKQAKFWNDNTAGVPMVIGIAAYKFKDPAYPAFGRVDEFGRQVDETRNLPNLRGCIWYRIKNLDNTELSNYVKTKYDYLSLMPQMGQKNLPKPVAPQISAVSTKITWQPVSGANKYAVYLLVKDVAKTNTFIAKLVGVVSEFQFTGVSEKSYTVTALNEDNTESLNSNVVTL
jgi:uncharacterized lipoprotein YddW (UPF0748 family)